LELNGTVVDGMPGEYKITYTSTDASGNRAIRTRTVLVQDTLPPEIHFTSLATELSPPNHKMELVVEGIAVTDLCGDCEEGPSVAVTVTSNESSNGPGSGDMPNDWEILDNADGTQSVRVRSERSGGGGDRFYTILIIATDSAGNEAMEETLVSVPQSKGRGKPITATALLPNHPNPFNAETQINFELATESAVELEVFDVMGRIVRKLVAHHHSAGTHRVGWDSRDDRGTSVGSGVYIYRLKTNDAVLTQRMLLLR
jgi:hypothetical protein